MASVRICVNSQSGATAMIVVFDNEAQRQDPAFAPAGTTYTDLDATAYNACESDLDVLNAVKPALVLKNPALGLSLAQRIASLAAQLDPVDPILSGL